MCDRTMITQQFQDDFCLLLGGEAFFGVISYSRGVLKGGYWKQARVIDFSSERQKNKLTKKGRLHYIRAYRGRDCIRLYIYQKVFCPVGGAQYMKL